MTNKQDVSKTTWKQRYYDRPLLDRKTGETIMMYTLIDELIAAAKAETAESVIEEARWCQFCGDELECFGCQVMPERNMEEQVKILKSKYNLPTTEQEGKGEK